MLLQLVLFHFFLMVQLLYLITYFPQEFPRSYKSSPLALVDQAHPTGMWHTTDQPESFPETSPKWEKLAQLCWYYPRGMTVGTTWKWVCKKKKNKSKCKGKQRGEAGVAVAAFEWWAKLPPQSYGLFAQPSLWKLFVPSNKFSSFLKLVWDIPTITKGAIQHMY